MNTVLLSFLLLVPSAPPATSGAAAVIKHSKPVAQSVSPDVALRRAYQREYAFLSSQKAALEKRLRKVNAQAAREKQEAADRLSSLQGHLLVD